MRNTNQTEQTFSQNFILEDSLRVKVSRTPHTHRIEWVCKIHRDSKSKAVWLPHTRCDGMQKAMYTWSDDRILEQTNFERTGEKPFFGRSLWTTRTTQKQKKNKQTSAATATRVTRHSKSQCYGIECGFCHVVAIFRTLFDVRVWFRLR